MTKRLLGDTQQAAEILRQGGLSAVPTETVYGLCGNGLDAQAVEQIYEVKGRPAVKPLSLMVPSPESIDRYCRDVPPAAYALAERFWPGPLTLVLPARTELIPDIVRAGGDTIGLRCPDHPLTLKLLRSIDFPLAGPSANPSGAPSPRSAEDVLGFFDGKIDAVLDGGSCSVGVESTILDLSRTPYRILRQGALPEAELWDALRGTLTVIGFTGGTGCGKTTALKVFETYGALVLDCDTIYHKLTREDEGLRNALQARFGDVFPDGDLDRKKLGAIVFGDDKALQDLNEITHRFVLRAIEKQLTDWAVQGGTVAAIDAIALLESGLADRCKAVVGVTADTETRVRRIMARDGISEDYARLRISAQKPNSFFEQHCTHILRNDYEDPASFQQACKSLFDEILGG